MEASARVGGAASRAPRCAAMAPSPRRPGSAATLTLREVVGERRGRTSVLRDEARGGRWPSPGSPTAAGSLPPLPAFMSCPALLEEGGSSPGACAAPAHRGAAWGAGSAAGEESDFSCAASERSGRSTARPSRARSPSGSLCGGDWWGHDAASETDSCRDDDDTMSTVSSRSSLSACSDFSMGQAAAATRPPRAARPHTATVRSSTGSSTPAALARATSDLACLSLAGSMGAGCRLLQVGARMPAEFEAIFSKARHGRYKEVNELLEAGADVDGTDARGNTPLHAACQGGSLKTVKALLRRSCETNAQNHQGNTPLHYAFAYKYEDVAEYLMRKGGALADIRNVHGLTPCEGLGTKLALERSADPNGSFSSAGDSPQRAPL